MHSKDFRYILFFITTVLFLLGIYYLYKKERQLYRSSFQQKLAAVVVADIEKRLVAAGEPYVLYSKPGEKSEKTLILSEDTIYIDKSSVANTLVFAERQLDAFQTILYAKGNFINPQSLDSLFYASLNPDKSGIKTGIRYTDRKTETITDSKPNDPIYEKGNATDILLLGLNGEISVQGFYLPTNKYLPERSPWIFISLFIFYLVFCLFFILSLRKNKKVEIERQQVLPLPKKDETDKEESPIKVTETILYDTNKGILYCNSQKTTLTKQMNLFLSHFLQAPDYFLSTQEINELLWGEELPLSKNKRTQAVLVLNNRLKSTGLKVKNYQRKGYVLIIP
ncbi:cbb3-type cytochrome oxidase subunit 3 [Parabacteroides sp. PFB2-12]|uniref:hypothetical protein n=1 Tax=unclassified Parabacteroides TaxID=2649774 RepID=UPI0024750207|nr:MULTISPECIES: hypothetical protein [unclassified Parabacteroides]MDH6344093.1 cbb3-type cytochrome oxidase subunit 3 [Parabacteroides sp. PM6-13]MDH6391540.1 cbb3-type cytochrome oxidase subunit 3 [Parabacteroides sp. PFB2-12]